MLPDAHEILTSADSLSSIKMLLQNVDLYELVAIIYLTYVFLLTNPFQ